jgi:hypothetical protein
MSIYNRHGEIFHGQMLIYDRQSFFHVSPVICQTHVTTGHCILCQCIHEYFVWLLLPSGSHNLNFLMNEMTFIYYGMSHVSSMTLHLTKSGPSWFKRRIYSHNPLCDVDEESISDILNEELDMTLMIRWIWKLKKKLWAKNQATKCRKVNKKRVLLCVDGWEGVTRNQRHTHLLKMQSHI